MHWCLFLCLILIIINYCACDIPPEAIAALRKELSLMSDVVAPTDSSYYNATLVQNQRFDGKLFPLLVVYCADINGADVVKTLKFADKFNKKISLRSGGHAFSGWCVQNGTIVLDMSRMNHIRLDKAANFAIVGPGVNNKQLFTAFSAHKKWFPIGTADSVSMGGFLQGGGWGIGMRQLGMAVDYIQSVTLVLADYTIVQTDKNSHPDLFWAVRGGTGSNFGVAISFTLELMNPPADANGDILQYQISWNSLDVLESVLTQAQDYLYTTDDPELRMLEDFNIKANISLHSKKTVAGYVTLTCLWLGDVDVGRVRMNVFAEIPGAVMNVTQQNIFTALELNYFNEHENFGPNFWHSGMVDNEHRIEEKTITSLWIDLLMNAPVLASGKQSLMIRFEALGGAINDISAVETAYVHRDKIVQFLVIGRYDKEEEASNVSTYSLNAWQSIKKFTQGVYANDLDDTLTDWPHQYFGNNYAKLQQTKMKYNPDNKFNFPQSIVIT